MTTRRIPFAATFASVLTLAGAGLAGLGTAQAASLPVVNMAAVEAAADAEGLDGNLPALGDDASTRLIQQALRARGFATGVDGWYGRRTTAAYAAYQRKLGYSGINANGLPGPSSLTRLGAGRFTVSHVVSVGSTNDRYGGKRVNTRTRRMLAAADARLAWSLSLAQGSYCFPGCAAASAHTHDGGGVVDVSVAGLSATQRWQTVRALRTVGFAAWLRTPADGFPYHIHAVAIGDPDLWQSNGGTTNRDQVGDYYRGRNGLANHGPDNTPAPYRVPFTWWEKHAGL